MPDLYSAILNPRGPNFEAWNEILGSHRVPLLSAFPVQGNLGQHDNPDEKNVEVYLLNLRALTLRQRARLLHFLAQKFHATIAEVEEGIMQDGVPIRAADVIVSVDVRAVV
jgi:hypothetical protein